MIILRTSSAIYQDESRRCGGGYSGFTAETQLENLSRSNCVRARQLLVPLTGRQRGTLRRVDEGKQEQTGPRPLVASFFSLNGSHIGEVGRSK